MISQSTLIDRLKINGSLARVAIAHMEREGQIKRIIHHHGQLVYSEFFAELSISFRTLISFAPQLVHLARTKRSLQIQTMFHCTLSKHAASM